MVDHSRNNGVDIGSILTTSRILMSFWTYKFFAAHRAPARGAPFFLCAKRQKGSLERNAKPLAHCIIPAAAAGWLCRPTIRQPHLSGRGPGTAESGPMRPRMGMQAARGVA